MKKFFRPIPAACICVLMLISCKKNDTVNANEQLLSATRAKEMKRCHITRMVTNPHGNEIEYLFTYNTKGDPVYIRNTFGSTGYPDQEFRYDKRGRLTDHIGLYRTNNAFEFWHEFGYDKHNRIVQDTLHIFGKYGEEPSNDFLLLQRIITFEYDAQDRIIRSTEFYPFRTNYPVTVETFWYDASGNRYRPGFPAPTYDDKISAHRTNDIWMFVTRDYSMNNPWIARAYNSHDLPVLFQPGDRRTHILYAINPILVEYDCKGKAEN